MVTERACVLVRMLHGFRGPGTPQGYVESDRWRPQENGAPQPWDRCAGTYRK